MNKYNEMDDEQVLAERTKRYATESKSISQVNNLTKIAIFTLANEKYGIAVSDIKEVFHLENLTPLPATPAFLTGIVNFRGKVLPVIDLKVFFQLGNKGISDLNKVIILEDNHIELGLLADSINDVFEIDLTEVQPALPVLTDRRAEYTLGLFNEVILLKANQIVNDEKLIINMI